MCRICERDLELKQEFNYRFPFAMLVCSWMCFSMWWLFNHVLLDEIFANIMLGIAIIYRSVVMVKIYAHDKPHIKTEWLSYITLFIDSFMLEMFRPEIRQSFLLQEEAHWFDLAIYIKLTYIDQTIEAFVWKYNNEFHPVQYHVIFYLISELESQRDTKVYPHHIALKHEMVYEKFYFQSSCNTLLLIFVSICLHEKFGNAFFSVFMRFEFGFTFGRGHTCYSEQSHTNPTPTSQPRTKEKKNNTPINSIIQDPLYVISRSLPVISQNLPVLSQNLSVLSQCLPVISQNLSGISQNLPINNLKLATTTHNGLLPNPDQCNVTLETPPVTRESRQYKMSARPKGMCVVINNRDFTCQHFSRRDGTDEDVKKLTHFFKRWQFELKTLENQTDCDMLEELKRISSLDHRAFDCFVCFILSHGQQETVFGSNGRPVSVAELQSFFSARQCRSLAKKPKLFFIQACQGDEAAQGVDMDGGRWECDVKPEHPVHELADFLTVFATVPGFIAYRNTTTGSPFISTLLDVIDKSPGSSLTDVIMHVTDTMDDGFEYKQIPMFKSTLRKQIVLNEKPC